MLTGGASSTYGADAVSGVVNFIMNTHYEGVKIDAQYGMFNHSNHDDIAQGIVSAAGSPVPTGSVNSGYRKNVSFVAGSNFADGKGNATVYATYDNQASNIGGQFDYSACSLSHGGERRSVRRIRHECRRHFPRLQLLRQYPPQYC